MTYARTWTPPIALASSLALTLACGPETAADRAGASAEGTPEVAATPSQATITTAEVEAAPGHRLLLDFTEADLEYVFAPTEEPVDYTRIDIRSAEGERVVLAEWLRRHRAEIGADLRFTEFPFILSAYPVAEHRLPHGLSRYQTCQKRCAHVPPFVCYSVCGPNDLFDDLGYTGQEDEDRPENDRSRGGPDGPRPSGSGSGGGGSSGGGSSGGGDSSGGGTPSGGGRSGGPSTPGPGGF